MPSTWDIWFKKLVQIRPQDFATWLLAEARCEKPVFVSSTLNSRNIYSDMLLRTQYHNEEILLHIEFQSEADNEMGRRLLEYNVLAGNQYTVPVYSFVIYLLKKGEVVRSPYTSRLPGGKLIYEFHYETIELWRASAKALFQSNLPMLLALVPFAKGGTEHAAIEQMLLALKEQQQPEAFMIAASIATAMYKGHSTDLEWLHERMKELFDEDLRDNPFYQSIIEEGVVKGKIEGRHEGSTEKAAQDRLKTINHLLLPMMRKRFPELVPLAQERAEAIDDLQLLLQFILKLMDAQTSSEARAILQDH